MKLAALALSIAISSFYTLTAAAPPIPTNLTLSPTICPPLQNPPSHSITLRVPSTSTTLRFSNYRALLSQTETDLCIIEALAALFATVVRNQQDGFLPLNRYKQSYGDVGIQMDDWAPPSQRLTYGIVASALRGLALFASLYGYVEVDVDVMDGEWGMVGTAKVVREKGTEGAQSG